MSTAAPVGASIAPVSAKVATAEKKTRAAKQDYGYKKDAKINILVKVGKEKGQKNYSGKRLEWFEKLASMSGKTVKEFEVKFDGKDKPRGWLRFFCKEGAAKLS